MPNLAKPDHRIYIQAICDRQRGERKEKSIKCSPEKQKKERRKIWEVGSQKCILYPRFV